MKKSLSNRFQLTMRLLLGTIASRRILKRSRPHAPRAVLVKLDHLGDVLISLKQILLWEQVMKQRRQRPVLLLDPAYRGLLRTAGFSGTVFAIAPQRFFSDDAYARRILHRLHRLEAESVINPVPQGFAEVIASQLGGRPEYTAYFPERSSALTILAQLCRHCRRIQYVPMRREESIYRNEARLLEQALAMPVTPGPPDLTGRFPALPPPLPQGSRYYVIAPGSSDPRRVWPTAFWSRVITLLQKRFPDIRPVITGSRSEKPLAEAILQALPPGLIPPETDQTGRTTIPELASLLQQAEWVLGNDCGTLHFAALLQKPAVGVAGLGHWGCFFPNAEFYPTVRICHGECPFTGCRWQCHWADPTYRCLAAVTPETVTATLLEMLSETEDSAE